MAGVSFVVDEEDSSDAARDAARRAERALRDVYESNNLAQLDFDSEIDASILGDGACKVTWDPDRAPGARDGAGRAGPVRLVAGRRRLARLARGQPLPALGRRGIDAVRGRGERTRP